MKKKIALLLAVCMCAVALTACAGHTFKEEWSFDATHHWHACEDDDCTEVADKGEHTFDEGKITTDATDTEEGVKTYTCSVCNGTKTEAVAFNGLSVSQYGIAIDASSFTNVTVTEQKTTTPVEGEAEQSEQVYWFADGKYSMLSTEGEQRYSAYSESADTIEADRTKLLFFAGVKRSQLTYDATTKVYTAAQDCVVSVAGEDEETIQYKDFKMTFSGLSVTTVEATGAAYSGATLLRTYAVKLTFSDYGSTVAVKLSPDANLYLQITASARFEDVTIRQFINGGEETVILIDEKTRISIDGGAAITDTETIENWIGTFAFLEFISPDVYIYNSTSGMYEAQGICHQAGSNTWSNVKFLVENGYMTRLEFDYHSSGVNEHHYYELENYGTTAVEEGNNGGDLGD